MFFQRNRHINKRTTQGKEVEQLARTSFLRRSASFRRTSSFFYWGR